MSRQQDGQIIANMGLFWKRDLVDWRGLKGRLPGTEQNAKKEGEVDFADQVGLYALYAEYHLVYVGRANTGQGCLGRRLKNHTGDHLAGRWDSFSWFGLKNVVKDGLGKKFNAKPRVPWDVLVRVLEGVLIEVAEPPQNGQGGCLNEVKQYLQVPWVNPDDDHVRTSKYISDIARYLWEREQDGKQDGTGQLAAAAKVLRQKNEPMTCNDIMKEIRSSHLWKPTKGGKTPDQTLHSAIVTEIKDKGILSRFRKTGRGRFALYLHP